MYTDILDDSCTIQSVNSNSLKINFDKLKLITSFSLGQYALVNWRVFWRPQSLIAQRNFILSFLSGTFQIEICKKRNQGKRPHIANVPIIRTIFWLNLVTRNRIKWSHLSGVSLIWCFTFLGSQLSEVSIIWGLNYKGHTLTRVYCMHL